MTRDDAREWLRSAVLRPGWHRSIPAEVIAYLDSSDLKNSAAELLHGPRSCERGQTRGLRTIREGWINCSVGCPCAVEQRRATNLARYGVDNPAKSIDSKRKTEATNIARYGTKAPAQSEVVQQKSRETNRALRGVDYPTQAPDVREKVARTVAERFGVSNVFAASEVKDRIKAVHLERRGVVHPMHDPEVRADVRVTNLHRFGTANPAQAEQVKAKIAATNEGRYGSKSSLGNPEVRSKGAETMIARYGTEHPLQVESIRARVRQTLLKVYGVENLFASAEVQERIRDTMIARHGVPYPLQSPSIRARVAATLMRKTGVPHPRHAHLLPDLLLHIPESFVPYAGWTAAEIATHTGYSASQVNRLARQWSSGLLRHKRGWEDSFERLLVSNGVKDYVRGYRKWNAERPGMEIDFFFPASRLGVELHGIYWHSTAKNQDRQRHLKKYMLASEADITLIQIFEDEWQARPDAVFTSILHRIGQNPAGRIGARSCRIETLPSGVARPFLDKHHHFGSSRSSVYIALMHNDAPAAVMAFRDEGRGLWELQRYATDGRVVSGGASRLLSAFERSHEWSCIKTFADLRWSEGAVYERLGFTTDTFIAPDYTYIEGGRRRHKFGFRKDSPRFVALKDSGMTETEMASACGFHRVYDAGRIRFVKHASHTI